MPAVQKQSIQHQIQCWNCEESVSCLAASCPYCRADLSLYPQTEQASRGRESTIRDSATLESSAREFLGQEAMIQEALPHEPKITPLPCMPLVKNVRHVPAEASGGTLHTALSLFFLLSGSSLFILSIVIFLFAKDGSFTISWPDHSWSAFFGLGTALMSFGTLFLQRLPEKY